MKKQIALLFFIACFFAAHTQSIEEQLTTKQISCYDVFSNSSKLLPQLYAKHLFDSMQVALDIVQQYCDSSLKPIFYLQTLLSIQQSQFSVNQLPQDEKWDELMRDYISTLRTLRQGGYQISKNSYYHYNNSESKLYYFIQTWAQNLLADSKLNDTESFLCNVLAGNIRNPQAVIKANKDKYHELYTLLHKSYSAERQHPDGNLAFLSGVWLPSGNVKRLGVHPSFGFQAGGRSKRHEVDFTMSFRFVSAANSYTIFRKDSLYTTRHFFGGYIGLDYTYYFIHTTNFETGLTGGIGYDGFDVADEPKNDDSKDYLKPYSIGALNLNTGLRCNYYFNPHFYIGIGGRFNKVNYKNKGGTNLHGNTASLDFFIGR